MLQRATGARKVYLIGVPQQIREEVETGLFGLNLQFRSPLTPQEWETVKGEIAQHALIDGSVFGIATAAFIFKAKPCLNMCPMTSGPCHSGSFNLGPRVFALAKILHRPRILVIGHNSSPCWIENVTELVQKTDKHTLPDGTIFPFDLLPNDRKNNEENPHGEYDRLHGTYV